MKKTNVFLALMICITSALLSGFFVSGARAGAPSGDDIVIFRYTSSERSTFYFQTSATNPDARVRERNRRTGYLVINLATGEYLEIRYWKATLTGPDGKRFRAKHYFADSFIFPVQEMYQTGPGDRKNYLVLSLNGTGMGNNFSYSESGPFVSSHVTGETLVGLMKVQRIRTALGIVECIAPSAIRGTTESESQTSEAGAMKVRRVTTSRKTLRLDKRRIRDAKDAGANSLRGFEDAVKSFLEGRGYERQF